MTADWLVCAKCAGRVSEARCPACRAQLARLREERSPWAALGSSPAAVIALLLGLLAVGFLVMARPA